MNLLKNLPFKYALAGAFMVLATARINLTGTGFETEILRYIVPCVIGMTAGFLLGRMKQRWRLRTDQLKKAQNDLTGIIDGISAAMSDGMPDGMSDEMSDGMSDETSDGMSAEQHRGWTPEDLVRKYKEYYVLYEKHKIQNSELLIAQRMAEENKRYFQSIFD